MALLNYIFPDTLQRLWGWLSEPAPEALPASADVEESPLSAAAEVEPPVFADPSPKLDADQLTIEEEEAQQEMVGNDNQQQFIASEEEVTKPMLGGGRSSVAEAGYNLLPNSFQAVSTDFPFHLLQVLENLSIFNPHLSYAVENVITLGATELEVYFSDKLSEDQVKAMRAHLREASGNWFGFTGSEKTMITDLFAQVATFGVISAEVVPKKNLSGIDYITKVPPRTIRFFPNEKTRRYEPWQQVPFTGVASAIPGFKQLNQRTYRYISVRTWKETPYPVPPFIAALEQLFTEADMLGSFKSMMRRMGMLGFLSVLVQAPKQNTEEQETDEDYRTRLVSYLNVLRPEVEAGFARGVTLGYKGSHDFELQGNQMNTQGAGDLLKIVKSGIFAGLHQDPNMHGESQATTETFGRVILAKFTAQISIMQDAVASMMEHIYLMELVLAGFRPGYVVCSFKAAMIGDRKRDEETELLRIQNVIKKIERGIISQEQGAQELGYDTAFLPAPPVPAAELPTPNVADRKDGKESTGSGNPSADKTSNAATYRAALPGLWRGLNADTREYDYAVPTGCSLSLEGEENRVDDRLVKHSERYTSAVLERFTVSVRKSRARLRRGITKLEPTASVQQFQNTVMYHLVRYWQRDFVRPVAMLATKHAGVTYRTFRKDKTVFTEASGFSRRAKFFTVPDATFGLLDYRAMEFLAKGDSFYLGKFITDSDTQQRILDFVAREYLGKNSPIGKGETAINAFLDLYQDQILLEAYKIRRITETTATKARTYANIAYMHQAELEEFEIVEVDDNRTCDYCRHMNGQTFSMEATVTKLQKVFAAPPEDTPTLSPFATSIPLEEFKNMSSAQLLDKGIHAPTYHCHCRGRVVGVI